MISMESEHQKNIRHIAGQLDPDSLKERDLMAYTIKDHPSLAMGIIVSFSEHRDQVCLVGPTLMCHWSPIEAMVDKIDIWKLPLGDRMILTQIMHAPMLSEVYRPTIMDSYIEKEDSLEACDQSEEKEIA